MLEHLLKENQNVSVTIRLEDLLKFGNEIASKTAETVLSEHEEKTYTTEDLQNKFGLCNTTIWRWRKNGLIRFTKIGNKIYYPESEVKRIINSKTSV